VLLGGVSGAAQDLSRSDIVAALSESVAFIDASNRRYEADATVVQEAQAAIAKACQSVLPEDIQASEGRVQQAIERHSPVFRFENPEYIDALAKATALRLKRDLAVLSMGHPDKFGFRQEAGWWVEKTASGARKAVASEAGEFFSSSQLDAMEAMLQTMLGAAAESPNQAFLTNEPEWSDLKDLKTAVAAETESSLPEMQQEIDEQLAKMSESYDLASKEGEERERVMDIMAEKREGMKRSALRKLTRRSYELAATMSSPEVRPVEDDREFQESLAPGLAKAEAELASIQHKLRLERKNRKLREQSAE
jgi:hypothetical protein